MLPMANRQQPANRRVASVWEFITLTGDVRFRIIQLSTDERLTTVI